MLFFHISRVCCYTRLNKIFGVSTFVLDFHQVLLSKVLYITGASKYTHITSTLRTLHWLPVRQRIIFKTLVLVYKYLTTGQPKYFAPYLPLYKSAVNTRRSNPKNLFLLVPSYCPSIHKSKVHFNNSFSYDAPKLWNDLPYDIRSAPNLSSFKSRVKTFLFQKSFPT